MRDYVVEQLRRKVIPTLERISGRAYDEDRLKRAPALVGAGRGRPRLGAAVRASTGPRRSTPTSARSTTSARSSAPSAAPRRPSTTTGTLRARDRGADRRGARARSRPTASMERERFRVVVEGPPNWTSFRQFWKMFADEGAVVVASTYTKVGGVYDTGFRHDPDPAAREPGRLLPGLLHEPEPAARASRCSRATCEEYRRRRLPDQLRQELQLLQRRTAPHPARGRERASGRPGGFIESDLVDPRYFSAANIKNRLESYFQMIEQKRRRGSRRMKYIVGIDLGSTTTKARRARRGRRRPRPRHHQQPQQLRRGLPGGARARR